MGAVVTFSSAHFGPRDRTLDRLAEISAGHTGRIAMSAVALGPGRHYCACLYASLKIYPFIQLLLSWPCHAVPALILAYMYEVSQHAGEDELGPLARHILSCTGRGVSSSAYRYSQPSPPFEASLMSLYTLSSRT